MQGYFIVNHDKRSATAITYESINIDIELDADGDNSMLQKLSRAAIERTPGIYRMTLSKYQWTPQFGNRVSPKQALKKIVDNKLFPFSLLLREKAEAVRKFMKEDSVKKEGRHVQ